MPNALLLTLACLGAAPTPAVCELSPGWAGPIEAPASQGDPLVDFRAAADGKGSIGVVWSTVQKGLEPNTASFLFSLLSPAGVVSTSYIQQDGDYWSSMGKLNAGVAWYADAWWVLIVRSHGPELLRFSEAGTLVCRQPLTAPRGVGVLSFLALSDGLQAFWSAEYQGTFDRPDFLGGTGSLRIERTAIAGSKIGPARVVYGRTLSGAVLEDLRLVRVGDTWDLFWMQAAPKQRVTMQSELHHLPDVIRQKDRSRRVIGRLSEPSRLYPLDVTQSGLHVIWTQAFDNRWSSHNWNGRSRARVMAIYQEGDSWSEPRILAESEGASPASCFALPIGDDSRVFIGWQCDNRLAYTTGRRDEWSPMVQTRLTLGPTKHDHHLGTDNLLVRSHDDEYILLTKMDGKLHWCTVRIQMATGKGE